MGLHPAAWERFLKVSIIIPVFNAERYLERCIESFRHQDLYPEEFEVLFVDNNSQDRSAEMILDSGPNIRLLRERKQGAYAARNRGLKVTRGEFIAFTDPDCVPRSDWLSQICQLLSDEKTQVVIGRVDCPSGSSGMSLLTTRLSRVSLVCSSESASIDETTGPRMKLDPTSSTTSSVSTTYANDVLWSGQIRRKHSFLNRP